MMVTPNSHSIVSMPISIEKLLKDLLNKVHQQTTQATPGQKDDHVDTLEKVFGKHKIDKDKYKDFFQALLEWRRT